MINISFNWHKVLRKQIITAPGRYNDTSYQNPHQKKDHESEIMNLKIEMMKIMNAYDRKQGFRKRLFLFRNFLN